MLKSFIANGRAILLRRQTNIISAAFVIAFFYGASMILGILRDRLLVGHFYACCRTELDVYWAAFRLPDAIFQLLVIGALSAAFIPVFTQYLFKNEKEAYHIASSLINILLIIFAFLVFLVFIFARPLSEMITGNFSGEQVDLMVTLTRIMLAAQLFFLLSNFLTGMIQSHQRFLVPALSPVVYNLGIIFGIVVLSPSLGIYGPTIGVVVGAVLHFLVQLPILRRIGFTYHFSFDFNHPGVREIGRLMLPRSLSLGISQIEATVALFIATSLTAGSLTIFYLASHLMQLPVRLVGIPIGQATLPVLSQKGQDEFEVFKRIFLSSFWQILYLVFPITAILLILRIPIVRLAFGAKGFPWEATVLTAQALAVFSLAIIAQAVIQLLIRGFYALHDTKIPLYTGVLSVLVNVILSIWLTFGLGMGILGLAMAMSTASFLQATLLLIFLDRKVNFEKSLFLIPLLKMGSATLVTGIFLWIPMKFLDRFILDTTYTINLLLLTITASIVGVGVYLFFSWVFKIEELKAYTGLAKRLGQWRQVLQESEEILDPQTRSQN
ncbi:MAG: murein biosynthesis integral membrane protein MurJ [bacterium]|nr:murein biosynthesis integral membrane protein MurJ [bacterium]